MNTFPRPFDRILLPPAVRQAHADTVWALMSSAMADVARNHAKDRDNWQVWALNNLPPKDSLKGGLEPRR